MFSIFCLWTWRFYVLVRGIYQKGSCYDGRTCCVSGVGSDRRRQAVKTAEEIVAEARKQSECLDAAMLEMLRQQAFEMVLSPQPDVQGIRVLVSLILKAKSQQLQESKVRKLLDDVADGKVTTVDEREDRLRDVFACAAADAQ